MRRVLAVLVVIVAALAVVPLAGQTQDAKNKAALQAERASALLKELGNFEFKAKIEVPATDGIFVEDGKLVGATYRNQLKDNPVALKPGDITKVSQVKVLDYGIQIFFASDTCALIGITGQMDTLKLSPEEMLGAAKKSVEPLFDLVPLKPAKKES